MAAVREVALPGTKFGIQLSHAGWKASIQRPWEDGLPLGPDERPWQTFGASARSFAPGWPVPQELDEAGLVRVEQAFVEAARRAVRLGFDLIELHMAHGYLLHSFASAISNHRTDAYGRTRDGRHAFPLRVARKVVEAVPPGVVVGARITGTDWLDGGIDVGDAAVLAASLKEAGISYVCVSSGAIVPSAPIPVGPLYQVPLAQHVKRHASLVTFAVGMIRTPQEAEKVIAQGAADLVAMARNFHANPRWAWQAAKELNFELERPPQYMRKQASKEKRKSTP
jgi:2,4-dienoyl-CoA reductase-like NADH-dependent reductase (Old Yellow Enzyme family)